jgi:hypothetical protein
VTSPFVVIALLAAAGWWFSTKRGNPMRSNANAAIYCTGGAVVLLGFIVYAIVAAARSNSTTESGPGCALAVLAAPFLIAFGAGAWIYFQRAKSQHHPGAAQDDDVTQNQDAP